MHKFVHNMMHYAISGIHESRKNCFRKSSSLYHVYLSISPRNYRIIFFVAKKLRALATFRKSLTIFTFFPAKNAKMLQTYSFVLCFVKKRICWRGWRWNVNYTCSSSAKFSTRRESTSTTRNLNFLCHLPSIQSHTCMQKSLRVLKLLGNEFSRIAIFLLLPFIPFSFSWLCVARLLRHGERERKIRGEASQCLVFCQTWSTHNRDISWKYY